MGHNAETAIEAVEAAGRRYAEAVDRELALEVARVTIKREAIGRIMRDSNPLTGKPHSASSADAVVEMDADYAAHLQAIRAAVMEKNLALTGLTTAKLRADLALATLREGVAA